MGSVKNQFGSYKIETGIPLPDRGYGEGKPSKSNLRLALESLDVGDSIRVVRATTRKEVMDGRSRINGMLYPITKQKEFKFATRTIKYNKWWELRVWRIK